MKNLIHKRQLLPDIRVIYLLIIAINFILLKNMLNLPFIADDGSYLRQIPPYLQTYLPTTAPLPSFIVFLSKKFLGSYPLLLRWLILLLHITNSLLVFKLAEKFFKDAKLLGFICAVLFALHPLNLTGIYLLINLGKILALTFMLAGIVNFEKNKKIFNTLPYFILALASDISAAVMPLLIFTMLPKKPLHYKKFSKT